MNDLKEILVFFGKFVTLTGDVTADKKVNFTEIVQYLGLWPFLAPAINNASEALALVKAGLTEAQRIELKSAFESACKLQNPITEELFDESIDIALHLIQVIGIVRSLRAAA
jgi:hypothetical protein